MGKPDPIVEVQEEMEVGDVTVQLFRECFCGDRSVRTHEKLPSGYAYCLECLYPISLIRLNDRRRRTKEP